MRQKISDEIWEQNYRGPNEHTLEDTWKRQALACASVEKDDLKQSVYEDFLWLLRDFRGSAGGRITANLGIPGRIATTMFNCYVSSPLDMKMCDVDSIEGIYTLLKAQAHTLKSEGGYGMNFSWIRPAGSYVYGIDGRTPGVVKFMELWDKSSEIITSGSEKDADKRKDGEKKKIRKGAQMGVLSCVSGDTLIYTDNGEIPVKELVGQYPSVYCTDGKGNIVVKQATKVWSNGVKKTVKITFDSEDYLVCTPDHKIMLSDGSYKEAQDLKPEDLLCTLSTMNHVDIKYYEYNPIKKAVSVIEDSEVEVFDISVPDYHNFVANGVFVHNCTHPDIEEFITAKQTEGRLSKFNVSVGVTDALINAVMNDEDWHLEFPDTRHAEYSAQWKGDLDDWKAKGFPVKIHKTLKARDLWEKISQMTYNRNEPGVLFIDTINNMNPLVYAEKIHTTNPCGEIPMGLGVCLLFSFNLVKFIKQENGNYIFDFDMFKKAVAIGTRFADNINDISRTPLPEYQEAVHQKRRIGLGVLGLGSLHYILGIPFASPESLELIDSIFKAKAETEILASAKLGAEKGSFPLFNKEKYFSTKWWKTLPIDSSIKNEVEEIGCMRNSHRSANAPTGNMGIYVGNVSGGIEPVFMYEFVRWAIVPEGDRRALREKGFEFPDVFKSEWFSSLS